MTSFYRRRHFLRKSHNSVVSFKGSILYKEERMVMNDAILDIFILISYIFYHDLIASMMFTNNLIQ